MDFSSKELRGKNTMLDRVQRQQDSDYSNQLVKYNDMKSMDKIDTKLKGNNDFVSSLKEPQRQITKAELGKKREVLR